MKIQSLSEKQLHKEVDSVKVIIEDNGGKIHYYDLKIDKYKGVLSEYSRRKGYPIYQEYKIKMGRQVINRLAEGAFAEIKVDDSTFRLTREVSYRAKAILSRVSP